MQRVLVLINLLCFAVLLSSCGSATRQGDGPSDGRTDSQPRFFSPNVKGGAEGQILRVTTLAESGPGSLREVIAQPGARVVVFEVAGTIELTEADGLLAIENPFLTLAGQTAPDPGITLRGFIKVQTHDVVIQHIRVRPGDTTGDPRPDGIAVRNGAPGDVHDIVVDHCSVSWATDENANIRSGDCDDMFHRVVYSHNLVAEGLNNSRHSEPHSKGMLAGCVEDLAVVGNAFVHNADRNPEVKRASAYIANNLVYNWLGEEDATHITPDTAGSDVPNRVTIIGNYYIPGIDTTAGAAIRLDSEQNTGSLLYLSDNQMAAKDNVSLLRDDAPSDFHSDTPPIVLMGYEPLAVGEVKQRVLGTVGARPAARDAVDARLVDNVNAVTGRVIDSQNQVGGWPRLVRSCRLIRGAEPDSRLANCEQVRSPIELPAAASDADASVRATAVQQWLRQLADQVEGQ